MAKKSAIAKQKRREKMVTLKWERRQELKKIISNESVDPEEKLEAVMKLNKLPRNSSKVRLRNRCSVTGRPRAYYRRFKLSRITFRELASHGMIPGVTRSSW